MNQVLQFPNGRSPPKASVDHLIDELAQVELELARARIAQIHSETRRSNTLWLSYCLRRVLVWGFLFWLVSTMFATAADAGWRGRRDTAIGTTSFYDKSGHFTGSSKSTTQPR
jgi:hypothetical protein